MLNAEDAKDRRGHEGSVFPLRVLRALRGNCFFGNGFLLIGRHARAKTHPRKIQTIGHQFVKADCSRFSPAKAVSASQ